MKERPILFRAEMVRAILDGRKTQTRRIVKLGESEVLEKEQRKIGFEFAPEQAVAGDLSWVAALGGSKEGVEQLRRCQQLSVPVRHPDDTATRWDDCPRNRIYCPYGEPGDRLWVKETHAFYSLNFEDTGKWHPSDRDLCCHYREGLPSEMEQQIDKWRPSIFMPRWASRITLEITSIRVERLQDISEADSNAEGIETVSAGNFGAWKNYRFKTSHPRRGTVLTDEEHRLVGYQCPVRSYRSLWEHINGLGSWAANPWVWVIEFRRIDQ